ncbi:nucleotidyltransferase domain-containing protein [Glycomyces sp. NPDC046736]|uniref:nucleotidyltransferase domain-containing protein n=1 Tax=Glycomyces sp. NPDC046736 TaxID=3155615 RepID=UPI0033D603F3
MHPSSHAELIAERLAAALAPQALGIALVGSVAAGTDHPHSDIDLICATAESSGTEIRQVEGRMVTLTRATPAALAAALTSPRDAAPAAAAWRRARILHDPDGVLASLQKAAAAWTWDALGPAADAWAAIELVGLAEEIHKICGMLTLGRPRAAAANRLIVTLALAVPYAAAHRISYDSENDLWDALADHDRAWAAAWDTAAGLTPADPASAACAALRLYRIAATALRAHATAADRALIDTATGLAERTIEEHS